MTESQFVRVVKEFDSKSNGLARTGSNPVADVFWLKLLENYNFYNERQLKTQFIKSCSWVQRQHFRGLHFWQRFGPTVKTKQHLEYYQSLWDSYWFGGHFDFLQDLLVKTARWEKDLVPKGNRAVDQKGSRAASWIEFPLDFLLWELILHSKSKWTEPSQPFDPGLDQTTSQNWTWSKCWGLNSEG